MNQIVNNIENIIDTILDVDIKETEYETTSMAEKLRNYNIVNNTNTKYYTIKFKSNIKKIAECRLCIISNTVGYIQSVEVIPQFRGQNIGSNITEYLITLLSEKVNKIYIYPTNNTMKHICKRKFSFKSASKINNWYVKNI